MIRDLKIFSVSSMISSTDIESEDSSLNRPGLNQPAVFNPPFFRGSYLLRPVIHNPAPVSAILSVVPMAAPCSNQSRDKVASSGGARAMNGRTKAATNKALRITN